MDEELYVWLESYGGTSYDLTSTIYSIEATLPFVSPFDWRTSIDNVLDQMDDAVGIIEKYGKSLPDNLPSKQLVKRAYVMDVLSKLVENIRAAARELGLDLDDITSVDRLRNVVLTMSELIDMLINTDLEGLSRAFEDHEDDNDDSFQEILDVDERDLAQLSYNVAQIRKTYFMTLDDSSEE